MAPDNKNFDSGLPASMTHVTLNGPCSDQFGSTMMYKNVIEEDGL